MLTAYELMLVLSPAASEEAANGVLERVTRYVNDKGGTVESQEPFGAGRRKLAYPINRHLEGNFVLTQMKMPSEAAAELESQLKINEQVLRHLLVKRNLRPAPPPPAPRRPRPEFAERPAPPAPMPGEPRS